MDKVVFLFGELEMLVLDWFDRLLLMFIGFCLIYGCDVDFVWLLEWRGVCDEGFSWFFVIEWGLSCGGLLLVLVLDVFIFWDFVKRRVVIVNCFISLL